MFLQRQDFTVLRLVPVSTPIGRLFRSSHGRAVHSIALSGEWYLATTPAMRQSVAVSLRAVHPGSELLLDLRGVSFCGSAGARAIVELVEQARSRHIVLRLAGVQLNVQRIFDLLGLGDLVNGAPAAA